MGTGNSAPGIKTPNAGNRDGAPGSLESGDAGHSGVGGLSERPMEPVLKTGGQKCLVGSNPTPSAKCDELRRRNSQITSRPNDSTSRASARMTSNVAATGAAPDAARARAMPATAV